MDYRGFDLSVHGVAGLRASLEAFECAEQKLRRAKEALTEPGPTVVALGEAAAEIEREQEFLAQSFPAYLWLCWRRGVPEIDLVRWTLAMPEKPRQSAMFALSKVLAPGPWARLEARMPGARSHRTSVLARVRKEDLEDAMALLAVGPPSGEEFLVFRRAAGSEQLRGLEAVARLALSKNPRSKHALLEWLGLSAALPREEAAIQLRSCWTASEGTPHQIYDGAFISLDYRAEALDIALDCGDIALAEELFEHILRHPNQDICYHGDWYPAIDPGRPIRLALASMKGRIAPERFEACTEAARARVGRALEPEPPRAEPSPEEIQTLCAQFREDFLNANRFPMEPESPGELIEAAWRLLRRPTRSMREKLLCTRPEDDFIAGARVFLGAAGEEERRRWWPALARRFDDPQDFLELATLAPDDLQTELIKRHSAAGIKSVLQATNVVRSLARSDLREHVARKASAKLCGKGSFHDVSLGILLRALPEAEHRQQLKRWFPNRRPTTRALPLSDILAVMERAPPGHLPLAYESSGEFRNLLTQVEQTDRGKLALARIFRDAIGTFNREQKESGSLLGEYVRFADTETINWMLDGGWTGYCEFISPKLLLRATELAAAEHRWATFERGAQQFLDGREGFLKENGLYSALAELLTPEPDRLTAFQRHLSNRTPTEIHWPREKDAVRQCGLLGVTDALLTANPSKDLLNVCWREASPRARETAARALLGRDPALLGELDDPVLAGLPEDLLFSHAPHHLPWDSVNLLRRPETLRRMAGAEGFLRAGDALFGCAR